MKLPATSDHQTLEQYLLMLLFFIQNTEKLYNEFSKKTLNDLETKKLKLCYEKFYASYIKIHASCYQIYENFSYLRETICRQGEILEQLRPEIEALSKPQLMKELDEISKNGLAIVTPLVQKQFDYFFAVINPCLAADISNASVKNYMQSLIKATKLAEDKYQELSSNSIYITQSTDTFYNFSLIFKSFVEKVSKLLKPKS